ncbi:MAG TPA: biotin--[acetyl-CoA-carboxylase] ligase [Jiangellaceae bacterium]|nr:biotin--[acetyl-CoA-carboxylase] ligase [Jiangellaceae bacterium]
MTRWREVQWVARTGSTNADLIAAAHAGAAPGLVRIADHQDSGRGRRGRGWRTDAGSGLAISALLRPDPQTLPTHQWPWIPLLAGVAVIDAVETLRASRGAPARLKWPNDVLLDGRKLAGILVEHVDVSPSPLMVVGIGINVGMNVGLPAETTDSAALVLDADEQRQALVDGVLWALAARWQQLEYDGAAPVHADYLARCDTIGRRVRVQLPSDRGDEGGGGEVMLTGVATSVRLDGCLLVREDQQDGTPEEDVALSAGDVVHLRRVEGDDAPPDGADTDA